MTSQRTWLYRPPIHVGPTMFRFSCCGVPLCPVFGSMFELALGEFLDFHNHASCHDEKNINMLRFLGLCQLWNKVILVIVKLLYNDGNNVNLSLQKLDLSCWSSPLVASQLFSACYHIDPPKALCVHASL